MIGTATPHYRDVNVGLEDIADNPETQEPRDDVDYLMALSVASESRSIDRSSSVSVTSAASRSGGRPAFSRIARRCCRYPSIVFSVLLGTGTSPLSIFFFARSSLTVRLAIWKAYIGDAPLLTARTYSRSNRSAAAVLFFRRWSRFSRAERWDSFMVVPRSDRVKYPALCQGETPTPRETHLSRGFLDFEDSRFFCFVLNQPSERRFPNMSTLSRIRTAFTISDNDDSPPYECKTCGARFRLRRQVCPECGGCTLDRINWPSDDC